MSQRTVRLRGENEKEELLEVVSGCSHALGSMPESKTQAVAELTKAK